MFRIALAVIALRVLDDNFLQPAAGTSPADHLVSGLVPLALLGLAASAIRACAGVLAGRARADARHLGIAVGLDAVYYTRELGLGSDDVTGFLAIAAGVGAARPRRRDAVATRSRDGHRAWRYGAPHAHARAPLFVVALRDDRPGRRRPT